MMITQNKLLLAIKWLEHLAETQPERSLKARLDNVSARYFDGQLTAEELYRHLINAFGADNHL
jgi:hypothetical protein